jgi:hypothetical protein
MLGVITPAGRAPTWHAPGSRREAAVRLIDLSSPVDASFWEPEPVSVQTMSAAEGARHVSAEMHEHFGMIIDPSVFPDGEFLTNDTVVLTTHTGTHIDAPASEHFPATDLSATIEPLSATSDHSGGYDGIRRS